MNTTSGEGVKMGRLDDLYRKSTGRAGSFVTFGEQSVLEKLRFLAKTFIILPIIIPFALLFVVMDAIYSWIPQQVRWHASAMIIRRKKAKAVGQSAKYEQPKTYVFYWKNGTVDRQEGESPSDALYKLGIHYHVLRTLDRWECES